MYEMFSHENFIFKVIYMYILFLYVIYVFLNVFAAQFLIAQLKLYSIHLLLRVSRRSLKYALSCNDGFVSTT